MSKTVKSELEKLTGTISRLSMNEDLRSEESLLVVRKILNYRHASDLLKLTAIQNFINDKVTLGQTIEFIKKWSDKK